MKKWYGILAYPAMHSLSPDMHNAGFKAIGWNGEYIYLEKSPGDLELFMQEVRESDIYGLSVSLPYKIEVMKYLDKIDENALRIGAVNTVVKTDEGKLVGYNTDYIGAVRALEEGMSSDDYFFDLKEKIVVILGGGGSARAIAYGCLKEGAHVWIKNRTKEKADRIAIDFAELFQSEIHSVPLDDMGTGDVLINATSIWLNEQGWEETVLSEYCDSEYLRNFEMVMDIVYKPVITPLLDAAIMGGCEIVTGEKMLLYQAIEQFKLWTGQEAPVEIMRDELLQGLE